MRQGFSKLFRASAAGSARAVIVGSATLGATYFMWNKKVDLPFMSTSTFASCAPLAYSAPNKADIDSCKADLMKFVASKKNMAPLLIRLSWHDAGTFDSASNTGGPRACMRFDGGEAAHGANAGL